MPSSVSVGSRPSARTMRSYSSGLRPWRSRTAVIDGLMTSSRAVREAPCAGERARSPIRTARSPSALPSTVSQARSGCGIRPTTLRRSLQIPAMLLSDAVRVGLVGDRAARVAVAEDHAPLDSSALDHVRLGEVVALAVRDRNAAAPGRGRHATVNGVSVCSTRTQTCSQWNFRSRLRSIAPGSSPASSSIWKPLQMPSTGPPRRGESPPRP